MQWFGAARRHTGHRRRREGGSTGSRPPEQPARANAGDKAGRERIAPEQRRSIARSCESKGPMHQRWISPLWESGMYSCHQGEWRGGDADARRRARHIYIYIYIYHSTPHYFLLCQPIKYQAQPQPNRPNNTHTQPQTKNMHKNNTTKRFVCKRFCRSVAWSSLGARSALARRSLDARAALARRSLGARRSVLNEWMS